MSAASLLFLQVACILVACRCVGWLALRVRQPPVVAEMVAGFLMGPSFFGWLAPAVHGQLFPAKSLEAIFLLSQLGLVLYMFCVGLEFDIEPLRRYGRTALRVSAAGIALPFALGAAVAVVLFRSSGFFAVGVGRADAVMFLGTALSITAFPMLARIISERGLTGTMVGLLALSAGAVDDAAAWVILAIVLSSLTGSPLIAAGAIAGALAYGLVVFFAVRPFLTGVAAKAAAANTLAPMTITTVLAILALGACFTEVIGMHPVFGAFVLGVAVPRGLLTVELRASLEPVTKSLLVPLFFAYSGLNSQLALVNSPALWLTTIGILIVACAGKGIGCWAAARFSGVANRDALIVATLMNCRGMVGLILLNIGLQYHIITPAFFTMLVLMAVTTTAMTGPLVTFIGDERLAPAVAAPLAARVP